MTPDIQNDTSIDAGERHFRFSEIKKLQVLPAIGLAWLQQSIAKNNQL
jgi:hypothetical protein